MCPCWTFCRRGSLKPTCAVTLRPGGRYVFSDYKKKKKKEEINASQRAMGNREEWNREEINRRLLSKETGNRNRRRATGNGIR